MPIPSRFFDRRVVQLQPEPESGKQRLEGAFSNFLHHDHIVLLGDPGAGKTVLFEQFATHEKSKMIRLGSFNRRPSAQITDSILYLDGLDECRAGNRHQSNAIDDVVMKLFNVDPAKVRISCRERDWLGSTDLAAFNDFFNGRGSTVVLRLEPLSELEQAELLLDKGIQSPRSFLQQAQTNGLYEFLGNPLTLGMLAETVAEKNWPASRTELFAQFSLLLLREKNTIHASEVHCNEAEMMAIAGSLMAHQLLSGIERYSLNPADHSADQPFYNEIKEYQPEFMLRVLNSRLFYCDPENQTTSYFHRTVAEFLAAKWLADKIRLGLPLGRVCALFGLDGYPTIELKGLYAWIPVFSPESALHFIKHDPYGVMTYGDVGQLSKSHKLALLKSLTQLSTNDPWFHSREYSDTFARGFISPDLKTELAEILEAADSEFHLRILLVDLIARSSEVNQHKNLLSELLTSAIQEHAIRSAASKGLAQSDIAASEVRNIYKLVLTESEPNVALLENLIVDFYGRVFSVIDVIQLIGLVAQCKERLPIGTIWGLRGRLSPAEALFLLENVNLPDEEGQPERENDAEIDWLIEECVSQILQQDDNLQLTPKRIWNILHKYTPWPHGSFRGVQGYAASILLDKTELLRSLIDAAFDWYDADQLKWAAFDYIKSTLHDAPSMLQLSLRAHNVLIQKRYDVSKSCHLYALALTCAFGESQEHQEITTLLWDLADDYDYLLETREKIAVSEISEWRVKQSISRDARRRKELAVIAQNRLDFEKNREMIRNGQHCGWLKHLGKVYWGYYQSGDKKLSPTQRLLKEFGPELLPDVYKAILSAASEPNAPVINDVIKCISDTSYYEHWRCYLAAVTEMWQFQQFLAFSEEDLKIIILVEVLCPVHGEDRSNRLVHSWLRELQQAKPKLLAETYGLLIEHTLTDTSRLCFGLERLMSTQQLEPYRKATLINLLQRFESIPLESEQELLCAVFKTDYSTTEIADLAKQRLENTKPKSSVFWRSVEYLFGSISMMECLSYALKSSIDEVWVLIGLIGKQNQSGASPSIFTTQKINEILTVMVVHFPNTYHPRSEYYGIQNAWDGAEFVRGLVTKVSADPSREATIVLTDLLANPDFETYKSYLKHSLTQQLQRYRETYFQKPTWSQVVSTMANLAPANVVDLHALVTEYLRVQIKEIKHSNLDNYKFFWNCKGKTKDCAKVEDDCRNVLLSLLRPKLNPLGISAEPEGYMVHSKRADIVVTFTGMKVPIELKRQQHPELWTAAEQQLHRLYTTAPESQGYGIYGVFWFGEKYQSAMPSPPNGLGKPKTAIELEGMLVNLLSEDKKQKTKVVVFDVSGDY